MIEIVCPSCQARYQLPEGSIGAQGRNVSCSSCSHKWRAYPEGAEAEAPAEAAAPAPRPVPDGPSYRPNPDHVADYASQASDPDESETIAEAAARAEEDARAIAATMASVAAAERGASAAPAPAPASGDREEQMDAIRKMLSDLKEGAEAAAAAEVVAPKREPEATAAPVMRRRSDEEIEDEGDALKSRIDALTKQGKAVKGEASQSGFDSQKLRKHHERRAKKLQKARERRKRSGAFITGFTFVAVITLTMVGLYVMKPQIVDAAPGMGPAMNEYVVTVDQYRVEINAKTDEWRQWVTERVAKLKGEEAAGGNAGGGGSASGTGEGTTATQ